MSLTPQTTRLQRVHAHQKPGTALRLRPVTTNTAALQFQRLNP
jgi:hypothetical protein